MSGEIFTAMVNIIKALPAISKDKQCSGGAKFNYRGIDDVYNALNPLMGQHGVFISPEVLDIKREERTNKNGTAMAYVTARVKYTFYAGDGSSVSCISAGEAMDSGDKATSKALSVAQKYALFQTFCIPTQEALDPDADSYDDIIPNDNMQKQSRLHLEGISFDLSSIMTVAELQTYWESVAVNTEHPDYQKLASLFVNRKKQIESTPKQTQQQTASANAPVHVSLEDARFSFMASNTPDALKDTAKRLEISKSNPEYEGITDIYRSRMAELTGTPAKTQAEATLTADQRKAIQASYSQWNRAERLDDITARLGRVVSSVNDLTRDEATRLIASFSRPASEDAA